MTKTRTFAFALCFLFGIVSKNTKGQIGIVGKFTGHTASNYIIFNPDSSFFYRYVFDNQKDISCGQYTINNDTINLFYKTNIQDTTCNIEAVTAVRSGNLADLYLLGNLSDTLRRIYKLYFKDNKLYLIKPDGHIVFTFKKEQVNYKPMKNARKFYYRKFLLFGPFIRKEEDGWIYKK